jgi:hypothetical protein
MDTWWLLAMVADYQRRDALREAEQYRLIRAAKGPRKARRSWTSLALMLSSLVGLAIRPQS